MRLLPDSYRAAFTRMSRLIAFALVCITTLSEWLKKKLVPHRHAIKSKTKTNYYSHANVFPRFASANVFASWLDWFIGLSVCFVIGQSEFFSFGFKILG